VSPRFVPASVSELQRIGLLASLPGETLTRLAGRMVREQLGPGDERGGDGRFHLVLSGLCSPAAGAGLLRPGDSFGSDGRPPGARAVTPAVVASCDAETYDEFLRPLLEG
jgi:CRP-like cAMP-binding protein